ncbi:hypothetical protein NLJ89_g3783 [Agrocybe chaxingu]|uniref:Uncharacterized protein n=1 Tax=Agrocybe chaxingu TaxID=84603 RepID=A0A9W8MYC8_9AGAR|nr:hypothetical protein NLJ89_g3783 [Agrocybe chaxingu]
MSPSDEAHPVPRDLNLKEGQTSTCHSQRKSQQDAVDTPRIASGSLFSAGIRSIFSGDMGPIVEAEMNRMKEKLRLEQKEIDNYRHSLDAHQYELQRSQREVRTYAKECHELQHERQRLVERNTNLVHELNTVNRRLEETKALSDTRGNELVAVRKILAEIDANSLAASDLESETPIQEDVEGVQRSPCSGCRRLGHLLTAARTRFSQQWAGTRILLTEAHALPYTDLLDKVDAFNKEVAAASGFLRRHIVYRSQDAFQEELDEACEEIEAILGGPICSLLASQSRNAELGTTTPPALFVQMITQLLIVAFSVSEISPRSILSDAGGGKSDLFSRDHHQMQTSQPPSSWKKFRTSVLKKLSMVFMTAAWSIPGSETRAELASRLEPLFVAKEDLRVAIQETFASDKIELAIVDYGASFTPEFMQEVPGLRRKRGGWYDQCWVKKIR